MNRSRWIFLFLICFVLAIAAVPGFACVSDEEVREALKAARDAFPDEDAVIVFDRADTVYKENGAAVTRESVLIFFRKAAASSGYRSLHYEYNPSTAHIRFVDVRVYRGEDRIMEPVSGDAVIVGKAPGDGIFWNFESVICPIPRLDDGDALYYCIERRGLNLAYLADGGRSGSGGTGTESPGEKNGAGAAPWDRDYVPPHEGYFMDNVCFQDSLPIVEKTYAIRGPRSRPLQFATANGRLEVSFRFTEDQWLYRFGVHDQEPYRAGPLDVSREQGGIRLALAAHPSWEEKSRWAFEHNEGQFIISPEMHAAVAKIIAGARDDDEKMFRLLHWTAENVRYLGLDMGEGEGHMVHRTDEIFRDLAGVCKDKAALLVSMLRAAGFDAYFVMTLAMEQVVDEIPSDVTFNHGVVAVRRPDGTGWTFLDPTWAPQNRPLFNHLEQEQPVLVAAPEGCGLMHIPYSPPEENPFIITAATSLHADGTAETDLFIETDGFMDGRFRYRLSQYDTFQRTRFFHRFIEEFAENADMLSVAFSDPTDFHQPMQVHIRARFPKAAVDIGDRLLFTPLLMRHPYRKRWESDYLHVKKNSDSRVHPVELICTRHVVFRETVTLPRGYRLSKCPEPVSVKGHTLDFQWRISQPEKRRIIFEQTIDVKHRITPAKYRDELVKASRKLRELQDTVLVIETAPGKRKSPDPSPPDTGRHIKKPARSLPDFGAEINDKRRDIHVMPDEGYTECYFMDAVVHTSSGIESFADRRFVVNEKYQDVKVREAFTLSPGGKRINAPSTAVNLTLDDAALTAPDFQFMKILTVSLVGVAPGSRLITDVQRVTRNTDPPEIVFLPAEDVPVNHAELTLTVPGTMTPSFDVLGTTAEPEVTTVPEGTRYTWRFGPLPADAYEIRSPPAGPLCPILIVDAEGKSWTERLQEIRSVFFDTGPPDASIKKTAERLVKNISLPSERLEALHRFVEENINTVSLNPRRVFHRLRSAGRILDTGYGMKIERLKVLAALVSAVGGETELLLAGPADRVSRQVPCLSLLPWRYLVCRLEGTRLRFGEPPAPGIEDHGADIVVARVNRTDVRMEWSKDRKAEPNRCHVCVTLELSKDNTLTGALDMRLTGGFNMAGNAGRKTKQWLKDLVGTFAGAPEITSFDIYRWAPGKPGIHVACTFKGEPVFDEPVSGIRMMVLPVCPHGFSGFLGDLSGGPARHAPFKMPLAGVETDIIDIGIPDGWRVVSRPDSADSSSDGLCFSRKVRIDDRRVRVERTLKIKKILVSPAGYASFLDIWRMFRGPWGNRLVFEVPESDHAGGKK